MGSAQDGQVSIFNDNKEYEAFTEKFKPKKTTDDCYTPPIVFDAVRGWVEQEYSLGNYTLCRPFYPGGDYEHFEYTNDAVVIDNPPFSVLSQILRFYVERGVRFFLFAPALTLFSSWTDITYIGCGVPITYENGAVVATSFVTNLDTALARTAPKLYAVVTAANEANTRAGKSVLPKYDYPNEVLTAAMLQRYCKYGVEFRVDKGDAVFVRALDAQKEAGKTIFGSGFLLKQKAAAEKAAAEKAAAEKAAAETWVLSPRERRICGLSEEPTNQERIMGMF